MNVSELMAKANQRLVDQKAEIAKLKALNDELTSALRDIVTTSNMNEAKTAVIYANTLLQSEAAK